MGRGGRGGREGEGGGRGKETGGKERGEGGREGRAWRKKEKMRERGRMDLENGREKEREQRDRTGRFHTVHSIFTTNTNTLLDSKVGKRAETETDIHRKKSRLTYNDTGSDQCMQSGKCSHADKGEKSESLTRHHHLVVNTSLSTVLRPQSPQTAAVV